MRFGGRQIVRAATGIFRSRTVSAQLMESVPVNTIANLKGREGWIVNDVLRPDQGNEVQEVNAVSLRLHRVEQPKRGSIETQRAWPLFDHLISAGKEEGRDNEADFLRSLKVKPQTEGHGLLDRNLGRFFPV